MSSQERKALIALRVFVVAGCALGLVFLYAFDWEEGLFIALGLGLLVAILLRLTVFR